MEHSVLLLFCVFGGNFVSSPELKQVWGSLHGSYITKCTETKIWQSQLCSVVFLVTLSKKKKSANTVSGKSSLTDYFNSIQTPSCDSNVGQLVPSFQVSFELRRRAEFGFFFFLGPVLPVFGASWHDGSWYIYNWIPVLVERLANCRALEICEVQWRCFYLQNMWYFIHITYMTRLRKRGWARRLPSQWPEFETAFFNIYTGITTGYFGRGTTML